jgi:DNA invertase Pin-like site-specific DNA recombinase
LSGRAAIYSRFSTDLQNEKSIEDQEAVARAYADRNGLSIAACYADAAQSGASIFGRDGLLQLLADAKTGRFDAVIVEELDRLSRDMEDLAGIHKRLTFCGVDIIAIHEGKANTVTIGLRGLVGQLFREDNVHKTKRGMAAKIRDGLFAGGKPYGYALDPARKGHASIVETEADIIRRIYRDYLAGISPREIAFQLNAERIPGPRGGPWQGSAIYGWPKRGTGILRNPIYDGRLVWNRMKFVKDPDTGRRVSRPNPPEAWETIDVPQLRIVEAAQFSAAQAMMGGRARTPQEAARMKRPKRLLSGLLKCCACGGGMSVVSADKSGRDRVICTNHRERRACPTPKTYYLDKIEALVIETLRINLTQPDMLVEYVTAYNEARREFAREAGARRRTLEKKAANLDASIERLIDLVVAGTGDADRMGNRMKALQAELDEVRVELAQEPKPDDVVTLHPAAIRRYADHLYTLKAAIDTGEATTAQMSKSIRDLVDSVTIAPGDKRGEVRISIAGKLRLLLEDINPTTEVWGSMVAGARFELTTFRL